MTDEQRRDVENISYLIWERNGRPDGRALDHWLEAEYILLTGALTVEIELPASLPVGIY
jgi:hypothetical protein